MMKRSLAGAVFVAAAAATALGLAAGSASADATITVSYPVTGTTHINATNSDIALGPGTLSSTVDLTTGAVTGSVTLPPSTSTFTELGIIPVTVTTAFNQVGQTTGTINLQTGAVTSSSQVNIQITDLKVAGIDIPVGGSCQTQTPVTEELDSTAGFSVLAGGNVTGTYTIPDFAHCGLATPLINLTIPGPGNTITLTLGHATVG
jgi:hypothetical protein